MASTEKPESHALPDATILQQATELQVLAADGRKLPFKQLYTDETRCLIIFIRHFFCGHCEDYVRALQAAFGNQQNPSFSIRIVGCGQPSLIEDYKKRTGCSLPIYADPSRALYQKLGMVQNLELGDKSPEYIKSGILGGTLGSIWTMIKQAPNIPKGGNYSQNGGEWLFVDEEVKWCHRMANTRDHAEIEELKEVLKEYGADA